VQEFPLPAGTLPGAIAAGPDGALWFAERNTNAIGRMTTAGELTDEFPLATAAADPMGIVAGPDGALWIAQREAESIARMTPEGVVTREFRVPGRPDGLTLGPDAALWFPEGNEDAIGRLDPGFDPPLTAAGTSFTAWASASAPHTVATFRDADVLARAGDYRVSIAWGDGSRSDGTVFRTPGGGFAVRGHHTYFHARTYRVVVRISDGVGKGPDAVVESTAHVHR
jgi:virginiamycin B lyase